MSQPLEGQSVIITAPKGVDILSYAKQTYLQPSDQVIQLVEHKKETGTQVGIFIEDIRDLQMDVRTSRRNVRTLVFISDAANMTRQAQAAFLKLLEEPHDNLYLLLLTSSPESLTDTILSRCHIIHTSNSQRRSSDPQIQFMSRGIADEITRLEKDAAYRKKRMALYELAKQFIGANAYTRLTIASSLQARPRNEVIDFVDAVIHINGVILRSKPDKAALARTKTLLDVGEALRENGNVRTQLLRIVI